MRLLIHWLINALALFALPYVFTSITVDSFTTALIVAVVLGLINTLIRPLLVLLTLPVTILCALLVGVSVLTTYQHHFIDIPTGVLLGLLSVWIWPPEGGNRLVSALRVPSRFSK